MVVGSPLIDIYLSIFIQAVATGLAQGDITFRKKAMPVHEFTNPPFPKAPYAKKVTHKVGSVAGHVFSVDFTPQFQSWESVDPAELFQAPIMRKPCRPSVVTYLQDEAKGADFIVLWMDCDRYVSQKIVFALCVLYSFLTSSCTHTGKERILTLKCLNAVCT
jgi:DNA topoisomerase-3